MDTNTTPTAAVVPLNSESTIESLLEMDLAQLEAMSAQEILAYLKPCLEVQPPIDNKACASAQPGTKIKLGGGAKSQGLSRGQIADKLINRGPKVGESNVLALLANIAKESGQDFDADSVLKHIKKK